MMTKLLLVDDDVTLLRFIQEYLEGQGFEVCAANSGVDALRLAYQEHPDLVVLDVMMPGMDGWEVTRRLRELSEVPIILVTAKSTEEDKLHGFQLGVDDYVTKPFSFAELGARIQAVLGRSRQAPLVEHNVIPIGDMLLDLDRHEVRRGEEVIQLTPTEFRLLEVLAERKGQAVSELEVIQQVWEREEGEETAAVRRYIWLLRNKLEPEPSAPQYIVTVRGYGYRLEG
ncbi:MAG: response regulator transcription factor [Anaerolineaceae bacterium]|nr:response regulator transcription factor [Anaerolineaceae bacterium]